MISNDEINFKHFSKENNKLYTNIDYKNVEYGNYIHKVLENLDFRNPNYSELDDFVKEKISKFVESDIFKEAINIYKEYEFIYEIENIEYHGFIDLMLEYKDEFKIVDYKKLMTKAILNN